MRLPRGVASLFNEEPRCGVNQISCGPVHVFDAIATSVRRCFPSSTSKSNILTLTSKRLLLLLAPGDSNPLPYHTKVYYMRLDHRGQSVAHFYRMDYSMVERPVAVHPTCITSFTLNERCG